MYSRINHRESLKMRVAVLLDTNIRICLPDTVAAKLCELRLVEVYQSSVFLIS